MVLSATAWAALFLIFIGNYYNKWGDEYYITCPLILFFSPGLLIFVYERHGLFNVISGVLALLIQFKYTVGIAGTWWLYIFGVIMIFLRKIISHQKQLKKIGLKVLGIGLTIGVLYILMHTGILSDVNGQVTYKLYRILEIFNSHKGLGIYMTPEGAGQARVEEIVSSLIELFSKPYFLLFGKGYGGTILYNWGFSDWNVSGSTFSDVMIKYRTYSAFHISIAEIIVNYGIVGIMLIFFMIKEFCIEIFKKDGNSYILLGFLWFIFFYSLFFSFNICLAILCCGLYQKYHTYHNNINAR